MDDSQYGATNKRGDWKPKDPLSYPPLFTWPLQPIPLVKWIIAWEGYILPWNLFYALVAIAVWNFATPSMNEIVSGGWHWMAFVLARNFVLAISVYGGWHLWLYSRKAQGTRFKFNGQWPDARSEVFLFKQQTIDNIIWTLFSGIPIWTAYECLMLWLFSNHLISYVEFSSHPVYFILVFLLIPLIHDVHFYLIHRALHWPPFYRAIHALHHNYVNPGPWSGLSMHPLEHLAYFSGVLIHIVLPSHPVHAMFHLFQSALGPAQSHAGFDRIVVGETGMLESHGYQHYLHHKYFECNYADGAIPLDKWFGTFHDGSPEAQVAMDQRFLARTRRAKGKVSASAPPDKSSS